MIDLKQLRELAERANEDQPWFTSKEIADIGGSTPDDCSTHQYDNAECDCHKATADDALEAHRRGFE